MLVVIDVNVIVSALIAPDSLPALVVREWLQGKFELLTCEEHIEELRRVSRYPRLRKLVPAHIAGGAVNDLRNAAIWVEPLPIVDVCRDRWDNYLLALAQAGRADYLVTGDKADLLAIGKHGHTRIVGVRAFVESLSS